MPIEKRAITREGDAGLEKLVEVRAFIPKDCIVDNLTARKPDGSRIECRVHTVGHVFEVI